MLTKIQKWGNSQGIRFPKRVLRQAHVSVGDEVDVDVHEGEIVVKPIHVVHGRYKLSELLGKRTTRERELDWGDPKGRETW